MKIGCSLVLNVGLTAAALFGALSAVARPVVLTDGARRMTFAEVDGASNLPLDFMWTGTNEDRLVAVAYPRYWIAEKMVTEAEFAATMERPPRPGREAGAPVVEIEWAEALAYCERLNQRLARQLPSNTLISFPTMFEWAHAVRVLDGKTDLYADAGTFLFTGSSRGGFLHTYWKDAEILLEGGAEKARERHAWRLGVTPKRRRLRKVGLRLVIVDITRTMQDMHPVVARGIVALQHGFCPEACRLLKLARHKGRLSSAAQERANDALAYAMAERDEDLEDWSGLVAVSAAFAERKGFVTEPFASVWQLRGLEKMADETCVAAYRKAQIDGGWLPIGDLPEAVRAGQVGNATNRVQVVACDFTGDGRQDLVVERFGAVGSYGYWYDFYRRQEGGVYTNVFSVQTVGLCVLPRKSGGGCGFLSVSKSSNPVLEVSLLSYADGRFQSDPANGRPFSMLDAEEGRIYAPAPFIGGGLGMGWSILEDRGVWYRPLYWPWKPGSVQGK